MGPSHEECQWQYPDEAPVCWLLTPVFVKKQKSQDHCRAPQIVDTARHPQESVLESRHHQRQGQNYRKCECIGASARLTSEVELEQPDKSGQKDDIKNVENLFAQ